MSRMLGRLADLIFSANSNSQDAKRRLNDQSRLIDLFLLCFHGSWATMEGPKCQ